MAKFIVRRLLLMLLTMLIVSLAVFIITEASPGNVARNVLGIHITPEQEASFLAQTGLDQPLYVRYITWLIGSDWRASRKVGMPLKRVITEDGFVEWWAVADDGTLLRWKLEGDDLIAVQQKPDGSVEEMVDNTRWQVLEPAKELERLKAYQEEVATNEHLPAADREIIQTQLQQIIAVLENNGGDLAAIEKAIVEPEKKLGALIDPNSTRVEESLQEGAHELAGNEFVEAVEAIRRLDVVEGEELTTPDLRSLARRIGKISGTVEDSHPELAETLTLVQQQLEAEDPNAARQSLTGVEAQLNEITAGMVPFAELMQTGDYGKAATHLEQLAGEETALGPTQQEVLPRMFRNFGKAVDDQAPDVGEPLVAAGESLEEGEVAAARQLISTAAAALNDSANVIAVSETARQARVVRTAWGLDTQNHAVRWEKGGGKVTWRLIAGSGWMAMTGGPVDYIPLQKGLLRGDPGLSLRTGRPVANLIFTRLRNSLVLAGIAFVIVMPLALVLGLLAGLNEGKLLDRTLSIGGMMFSVTPEFATGIFLILIFAYWLGVVPGATVFGENAPWSRPDMLVLPVATLTLIELGYVLRITRASMVEVMKAPYIRTAILKGLPYRHIILKHAIRNALMAPITVIMLHVNWLLGGIVVVEVIFGYPGLGSYLLDSALFKDFNAIEAGAIILVAVAVGTQLIADIIYTFLNPRIRFA
jgi:ABC-type dipeptide/oligopeptide/nickel transport system permease component